MRESIWSIRWRDYIDTELRNKNDEHQEQAYITNGCKRIDNIQSKEGNIASQNGKRISQGISYASKWRITYLTIPPRIHRLTTVIIISTNKNCTNTISWIKVRCSKTNAIIKLFLNGKAKLKSITNESNCSSIVLTTITTKSKSSLRVWKWVGAFKRRKQLNKVC